MADFNLSGFLEIQGILGLDREINNLQNKLRNTPQLTAISQQISSAGTAAKKTKGDVAGLNTQIVAAATSAQDFGDKAALALRRFTAFTIAAGTTYGIARAVFGGLKDAALFERELVKVQQVTNSSRQSIAALEEEIGRLGVSLAAPAQELAQVSVTLSQAGFSVTEVAQLLEGISRTRLAATFGDVKDTTEGVIAIMGQFKIPASEVSTSLGLINAAAAEYAVESQDLIAAIKRTGGAFAVSSEGIAEGNEALAQFNALITSVRATTRQAPETIATGLRTVIARLQRPGTIDFLEGFGISLRDAQGNFVGVYEAIQRIGEALENVNTRSEEYALITEKIGGTRQYGVVVPLIQQFRLQQEILNTQLERQNSLLRESEVPLETLVEKFNILTNSWANFSRDVYNSPVFQFMANQALELANSLVKVLDNMSDLIPLVALLGGVNIGRTLYREGVGGVIRHRLVTGDASPNIPRRAQGGYIPGYGSGDKQLIASEAGEFVIRKRAAKQLGPEVLHRLNNVDRMKRGGVIPAFREGGYVGAEPSSGKFMGGGRIRKRYEDGGEIQKYASGGEIPKNTFGIENIIVEKGTQYEKMIKILRNPSYKRTQALLERTGEIRMLADQSSKDYYAFNAYDAAHDDVRNALKINYNELDELFRFYANTGPSPNSDLVKENKENKQNLKNYIKYLRTRKFAKGGEIEKYARGGQISKLSQRGQGPLFNFLSPIVRLYRGETHSKVPPKPLPKTPAQEYFFNQPRIKASIEAEGRYFSRSLEDADYYTNKLGEGAGITYIDIARKDLEKYRVSNQPALKEFPALGQAEKEFFVTKELAQQRKFFGTDENYLQKREQLKKSLGYVKGGEVQPDKYQRGGLVNSYLSKYRRKLQQSDSDFDQQLLKTHQINLLPAITNATFFDETIRNLRGRDVYKELSRLKKQFPGVEKNIQPANLYIPITEQINNELAGYYNKKTSEIGVAGLLGGQNKLTLQKTHSTTPSFLNVFRHEYGHHQYYNQFKDKDRERFDELANQYIVQDEFSKSFEEKVLQPKLYNRKSSYRPKVSDYANKGAHEFFAESFGAYTHKDYKGGLPRDVEDFLNERFRRKRMGGRIKRYATGGKIPRSPFGVEELLIQPGHTYERLIKVLRNPTYKQSVAYLEQTKQKRIRGLPNIGTRDYYIFDAYDANHPQVTEALSGRYFEYPETPVFDLTNRPEDLERLKKFLKQYRQQKTPFTSLNDRPRKFAAGGKIPKRKRQSYGIEEIEIPTQSTYLDRTYGNMFGLEDYEPSNDTQLIKLIRNAPVEQAIKLLDKHKFLKFIGNKKTTDYYLFNAYSVLHDQVKQGLGVDGKDLDYETFEKEKNKYRDIDDTKRLKKTINAFIKGKPRTFATGGYILGVGSGDRVPILAEPGEFVIRKKAAQSLGEETLNRLNHVDKLGGGGTIRQQLQTGGVVVDDDMPRYMSGGFIGKRTVKRYQHGGTIKGYVDGGTIDEQEFETIRKRFRNLAKNVFQTREIETGLQSYNKLSVATEKLGIEFSNVTSNFSDEFNKIANEIRQVATTPQEAEKLFRGYIQAIQTPVTRTIPTQIPRSARERQQEPPQLLGGGTQSGSLDLPLSKTAKEQINREKRLENLRAAHAANERRRRKEFAKSIVFERSLLEEVNRSFERDRKSVSTTIQTPQNVTSTENVIANFPSQQEITRSIILRNIEENRQATRRRPPTYRESIDAGIQPVYAPSPRQDISGQRIGSARRAPRLGREEPPEPIDPTGIVGFVAGGRPIRSASTYTGKIPQKNISSIILKQGELLEREFTPLQQEVRAYNKKIKERFQKDLAALPAVSVNEKTGTVNKREQAARDKELEKAKRRRDRRRSRAAERFGITNEEFRNIVSQNPQVRVERDLVDTGTSRISRGLTQNQLTGYLNIQRRNEFGARTAVRTLPRAGDTELAEFEGLRTQTSIRAGRNLKGLSYGNYIDYSGALRRPETSYNYTGSLIGDTREFINKGAQRARERASQIFTRERAVNTGRSVINAGTNLTLGSIRQTASLGKRGIQGIENVVTGAGRRIGRADPFTLGIAAVGAQEFLPKLGVGQVATDTIGGILSGASAGALVGGPKGAAIGAVVGGANALVNASQAQELAKVQEKLASSTTRLEQAFNDLAAKSFITARDISNINELFRQDNKIVDEQVKIEQRTFTDRVKSVFANAETPDIIKGATIGGGIVGTAAGAIGAIGTTSPLGFSSISAGGLLAAARNVNPLTLAKTATPVGLAATAATYAGGKGLEAGINFLPEIRNIANDIGLPVGKARDGGYSFSGDRGFDRKRLKVPTAIGAELGYTYGFPFISSGLDELRTRKNARIEATSEPIVQRAQAARQSIVQILGARGGGINELLKRDQNNNLINKDLILAATRDRQDLIQGNNERGRISNFETEILPGLIKQARKQQNANTTEENFLKLNRAIDNYQSKLTKFIGAMDVFSKAVDTAGNDMQNIFNEAQGNYAINPKFDNPFENLESLSSGQIQKALYNVEQFLNQAPSARFNPTRISPEIAATAQAIPLLDNFGEVLNKEIERARLQGNTLSTDELIPRVLDPGKGITNAFSGIPEKIRSQLIDLFDEIDPEDIPDVLSGRNTEVFNDLQRIIGPTKQTLIAMQEGVIKLTQTLVESSNNIATLQTQFTQGAVRYQEILNQGVNVSRAVRGERFDSGLVKVQEDLVVKQLTGGVTADPIQIRQTIQNLQQERRNIEQRIQQNPSQSTELYRDLKNNTTALNNWNIALERSKQAALTYASAIQQEISDLRQRQGNAQQFIENEVLGGNRRQNLKADLAFKIFSQGSLQDVASAGFAPQELKAGIERERQRISTFGTPKELERFNKETAIRLAEQGGGIRQATPQEIAKQKVDNARQIQIAKDIEAKRIQNLQERAFNPLSREDLAQRTADIQLQKNQKIDEINRQREQKLITDKQAGRQIVSVENAAARQTEQLLNRQIPGRSLSPEQIAAKEAIIRKQTQQRIGQLPQVETFKNTGGGGLVNAKDAKNTLELVTSPKIEELQKQLAQAFGIGADAVNQQGLLIKDSINQLDAVLQNKFITGVESLRKSVEQLKIPENINMNIIHTHNINVTGIPNFELLSKEMQKIAEETTTQMLSNLTGQPSKSTDFSIRSRRN